MVRCNIYSLWPQDDLIPTDQFVSTTELPEGPSRLTILSKKMDTDILELSLFFVLCVNIIIKSVDLKSF